MRSLRLTIVALAASAAPVFVHAQSTPPSDPLNVSESHVTRHIDCGGKDLSVSGSDDMLTLANCNVISVVGSRNRIHAKLLPSSTIAALGNNNHIVFEHAPAAEVQVTSTGADNEIVPQMSDKDMHMSPPGPVAAPK